MNNGKNLSDEKLNNNPPLSGIEEEFEQIYLYGSADPMAYKISKLYKVSFTVTTEIESTDHARHLTEEEYLTWRKEANNRNDVQINEIIEYEVSGINNIEIN